MALAGRVELDAHVPFAGEKSQRYGVPLPSGLRLSPE